MFKKLTARANFHSPVRSTLAGFVLVLAGTAPSAAEPGWKAVSTGIEQREGWVSGKPGQSVQLLRFEPRRARIKHLAASDYGSRWLRAEEFREKSGALAVYNGGYFDDKGVPLGLLYAGSWVQPSPATGSAFGGLFSLIGDRPALHPMFQLSDAQYDSLRGARGLQFMLQCGPRLLSGGQPVAGLEKNTFRRRTCIGIDAAGRVYLLASAPHYQLSFQQLQTYLQTGLGLRAALNLDGGSSTQSAVRGGSANPGYSALPFALGVFAR